MPLIVFLFCILIVAPLRAQENYAAIYKKIAPSVVTVRTYVSQESESFFQGSGFFVEKENRQIITNYHIFEGVKRGEVLTADQRLYPVKEITAMGGLALLSVEIPSHLVYPLEMSRRTPEVEEPIIVISSPLALQPQQQSLSTGIVSGIQQISPYGKVIQITAPISPRSNGSPVVSVKGEVIGVAKVEYIEGKRLLIAIPAQRILDLLQGRPVEVVKPSAKVQPPAPSEVKERPKQQVESRGIIAPTRKSFVDMIDPWFILLIILVMIGVILLTLILKFIPSRKKPVYEVKTARLPMIKNLLLLRSLIDIVFGLIPNPSVRAEALVGPLRIKTPIEGFSLKEAPIIGEYRVIGKIASGGMANIYKATHVKKGWIVALKVPNEQFQNDKNFIERFRREAELGKKLHNENIIRIYEYGTTEDGLTYIAMDYLDGVDLRQYLDMYGKMPINDAIKTIVSICRALDYAHIKGVIHMDIKPENIMLPNRKEKGKVVLMDFGVAHAATLGTLGTKSTYMGTPYYMSPDQLSGIEVDARSDIYSLGIVFFEMLAGERPFNEADPLKVLIRHRETLPPKPSSLDPKIPAILDSIVLKMLEKKRESRYQNIESLINALEEYMLREGINAD